MINSNTIKGSVQSQGDISGEVKPMTAIAGTVSIGGSGGSKNAVLYVEQDLTDEQIDQARKNIRVVGESVEGKTQYPFNLVEIMDYDEFVIELLDPVVCKQGAEIYNDYNNNIATGMWAVARGCGNQALGDFSDASGWLTVAGGFCSISSGRQTKCSGNYSHAEGHNTIASANDTHAEGESCQALKARAHAEGYYTVAQQNQAHSEGMNTVASGVNSHAEGWGTTASGQNAFSGGRGTTASATNSTAKGQYTIASAANQTALGKYNIKDTTSLIIVGKGTADTARSNAFTLSSAGAGWFAGAVTSTGADYAEYFEWADGNPNAEDRIGMAVTLDGDKIRFANAGDDVLGIVSGSAMVVGDNYLHEWREKYLTDDYGRILYDAPVEEFSEYVDDVTGEVYRESMGFHAYPKLNPAFDPAQEYISRADRKEWDAIGLIGKLHARDDGRCTVGGYAKVGTNGVLTQSTERTGMRVMKRISDSVILVMLK